MKRTTKFLLVLLILPAVFVVSGHRFSSFLDGPLRRKALIRREIALRVLGEYLATEFAGQDALIVSNPFTQRSNQPSDVYAFEKAGIRGLVEGWADKLHLRGVVFPELNPDFVKRPSAANIDPHTTTPLSFLTAEHAWDSLLQKNPNADLVVSLIGLPANLRTLEIWRKPKPQFALLFPDLRMIGSWADVKQALRTGKVAAIVLEKPGGPPDGAALDLDYRTEFNRRFVLVTSRNIDVIDGPSR